MIRKHLSFCLTHVTYITVSHYLCSVHYAARHQSQKTLVINVKCVGKWYGGYKNRSVKCLHPIHHLSLTVVRILVRNLHP